MRLLVIDSSTVLWGQTIMYTAYCLAIISLVWWFATRITRPTGESRITPKIFYIWVGFLAVVGVSLHLVTYNTIPWVKDDLKGSDDYVASYDITVGDHAWQLPEKTLQVPCGELVQFSVTSTDLTYGFGLFRDDDSMVAQMQVVPGHDNDLLWTFESDGLYSIRSTEYSGPEGDGMIVPDAVEVTGCDQSEAEGGAR
ncbi:MAG: cytochrome C oxidase subunit II [Nocardioides sp.]|nr:cytochrome C oxidase subunit II [Nocardioides sp.]